MSNPSESSTQEEAKLECRVGERSDDISLGFKKNQVIGRDRGCDIQFALLHLPNEEAYTLSRRHALVSEREGAHYLKDLGSTNGTYLNGEKIDSDKNYELKDGAVIKMGPLQLTYHKGNTS